MRIGQFSRFLCLVLVSLLPVQGAWAENYFRWNVEEYQNFPGMSSIELNSRNATFSISPAEYGKRILMEIKKRDGSLNVVVELSHPNYLPVPLIPSPYAYSYARVSVNDKSCNVQRDFTGFKLKEIGFLDDGNRTLANVSINKLVATFSFNCDDDGDGQAEMKSYGSIVFDPSGRQPH